MSDNQPEEQITTGTFFGCFSEAWGLFMKAPLTYALWGLATMAVTGVFNLAGRAMVGPIPKNSEDGGFTSSISLFEKDWLMTAPTRVIGNVAVGLLIAGLFYFALKQISGLKPKLGDVVEGMGDAALQVGLASFAISVLINIGAVFCILPAFVVLGVLLLTLPALIDQRLTAIDALKYSFTTLKSQWTNAAMFCLVAAAITLSGLMMANVLHPAVGLVVMVVLVPVFAISVAVLYSKFEVLHRKYDDEDEPAED
jgi:hypothetical protein